VQISLYTGAAGQALDKVVAVLEHPRPLFGRVGQAWVNLAQLGFRAGTAPDGTPWKRSYRAESEGGQTLVDTGTLRRSITAAATDVDLVIGTNLRYARIHQFGGTIRAKTAKALRFQIGGRWFTRKSVKIPARPFLPLGEVLAPAYEKQLVKIATDAIDKAAS